MGEPYGFWNPPEGPDPYPGDALINDANEGVALRELRDLIGWMDDHLDSAVAETYKDQPLAQDWARVAKVAEEAGEAVDALIGRTGQNPRKGFYGKPNDLLDELADVALTGLYAIQHFTKNRHETVGLLMDRARYHKSRVEGRATPTDRDPAESRDIEPPSHIGRTSASGGDS